MALPLPNLSFADASSLAMNPATGFAAGGFVFGGARQLGGTGNRLDSQQTPTATASPVVSPSLPNADGPLGFSGGAAVSAAPSILVPAAILGGALLLAAILLRK